MELNGLLLIDKPSGMTSHDVVAKVRRIVGQKSVGHTGTLDPLATGLMVVVLGEATKLSDYLMATDKSYRVQVRFGQTSDTMDRTGTILSQTACDLSEERLRESAAQMQGRFAWPVPIFSAAKVDGKKLYEYGRKGEDVALPVKEMSFWGVEVHALGHQHADVSVSCSKGSFIRSWVHEWGKLLGVGGLMDELRRTQVGAWRVEHALNLEDLEALGPRPPAFIPMGQALPDLKSVVAGPKEVRLVTNGQIPHDIGSRLIFEQKQAIATEQSVYIKVLTSAGDLLAILAAEPRQGLKIRRVFRSFA